MRLVFLGSPPFATPIVEGLAASRHEILAVVTPPDRPRGRGRTIVESELAQRSRELGLPLERPETTKSAEFLDWLAERAPDVIVVASFGEILRRGVLAAAPHGCLNVHASLLPRHRGASPIQAAILAGDESSGVSVQRIVPALDEGDVLLALSTPIDPRENAGELLARLARLGATAIVRALDLLESGKALFTPQDHARATWARKLEKDAGRVDWRASAAAITRHVRAMTPWPGARATLAAAGDLGEDVRELVLLEVVPAAEGDGAPARTPGDVQAVGGRLLVTTGTGLLEVLQLKPAGKPAMSAEAFLRGARLAPGARFRV